MARRQDEWQAGPGRSRAWTALGWFWAIVLGGTVAGAVVLQVLGPPPRRAAVVAPAASPPRPQAAAQPAPEAAAPKPVPARAPAEPPPAAVVPPAALPAPPAALSAPPAAGSAATGAIATPQAALMEPAPGPETAMLPRIGPDGRMPMQAYAAPFDAANGQPRVAVLLAGIGMAAVDSEEAIRATPGAISLAISPYAARPGRLLEVARATGHETLVSIPMEPLGYPLNDAGNHSLLTGLSPEQNHERLLWALSRIAGYVGATSAISGLRGERFAASDQMPQVVGELGARGLLYIDPRPVPVRPGAGPPVQPGMRIADLLIDEPPVRTEIEAKLARLEQLARDRGSALGVAGLPGPVTVERLAAWATTLPARGLVLVPVSALVPPPVAPSPKPAASRGPTSSGPTSPGPNGSP